LITVRSRVVAISLAVTGFPTWCRRGSVMSRAGHFARYAAMCRLTEGVSIARPLGVSAPLVHSSSGQFTNVVSS